MKRPSEPRSTVFAFMEMGGLEPPTPYMRSKNKRITKARQKGKKPKKKGSANPSTFAHVRASSRLWWPDGGQSQSGDCGVKLPQPSHFPAALTDCAVIVKFDPYMLVFFSR